MKALLFMRRCFCFDGSNNHIRTPWPFDRMSELSTFECEDPPFPLFSSPRLDMLMDRDLGWKPMIVPRIHWNGEESWLHCTYKKKFSRIEIPVLNVCVMMKHHPIDHQCEVTRPEVKPTKPCAFPHFCLLLQGFCFVSLPSLVAANFQHPSSLMDALWILRSWIWFDDFSSHWIWKHMEESSESHHRQVIIWRKT